MAISREDYVSLIEKTIETPGWDLIKEDAERSIYELQASCLEAPSWDKVQQMRGRAEQLAELVALPEMIAALRAELEGEEEYADL